MIYALYQLALYILIGIKAQKVDLHMHLVVSLLMHGVYCQKLIYLKII